MTREISFKAWNHKWKSWINDEFMISNCGSYVYVGGDRFNTDDEVTLCEFTGLTDKNGKKIYEGDIVHTEWRDQTGVINASFASFDLKNGIMIISSLQTLSMNKWKQEVLGNIHENPELINN